MYDEKGAREAKEPQSPVYRGDDCSSVALTPNQVGSKNNKPHSQLRYMSLARAVDSLRSRALSAGRTSLSASVSTVHIIRR